MSLDPLYVLRGEVSVQVLCPFFGFFVFLEWSLASSLYILEIKPLSEESLTNMFSHVVDSLSCIILVERLSKLLRHTYVDFVVQFFSTSI